MISELRLLGMLFFGLVAVVTAAMGFISTFMYKKHGSITKKTILASGAYVTLMWSAVASIIVLWNPTYASIAVFLLILGGFTTLAYVGCSYFNLLLVEKGPRAMFRSVQQFVKKLFTRRR